MIKIFIRTTGERKLHKSIEKELKGSYTLLVDKEHKPVDSFIKQLKEIDKYDSILLEDDVILCKNFLVNIEKAISEWPNQIINFFTMPHEWFTSFSTIGHFVYNQCTYYPKGISKRMAEEMERIRKPYNQYDTLENLAMYNLNIPSARYRPCLVQHIDHDTLIQKDPSRRRSPYFIDYLDELHIDYNEAYKYKEKLTELMKSKFKEIDSKK